MELKSELCAGQSSSSTLILTNHFFMDLALCMGYCHDETRKDLPQIVTKVVSTVLSRMSSYAVALRFPFTGSKGPSPNHGKQPQTIFPPLNFKIGTMHLAGSVHPASAKPRFICRTATLRNAFPLLQSPMASSFTPLQLTLGFAHIDLRLVCSSTISGSSGWTVLVLTLLPETVWNIVKVATDLYALQHSVVPFCDLCGLPLRGWAVVAPRHFHFTITAQVLVGKVASYDGATLKVTELSSKAILLPRFVYGDFMTVLNFLHLSANCGWNSWIH